MKRTATGCCGCLASAVLGAVAVPFMLVAGGFGNIASVADPTNAWAAPPPMPATIPADIETAADGAATEGGSPVRLLLAMAWVDTRFGDPKHVWPCDDAEMRTILGRSYRGPGRYPCGLVLIFKDYWTRTASSTLATADASQTRWSDVLTFVAKVLASDGVTSDLRGALGRFHRGMGWPPDTEAAHIEEIVAVMEEGSASGTIHADLPPAMPMGCLRPLVTQVYGMTAWEHPHTGVDLVCPYTVAGGHPDHRSVPVYATFAGTVHDCSYPGAPTWPHGFGWYATVLAAPPGGPPVRALYGHLGMIQNSENPYYPSGAWDEPPFVGAHADGSGVSPGDAIGYMGSSGWSTGPHLHFEVEVWHGRGSPPGCGDWGAAAWQYVDPNPYLAAAYQWK